MTTKLSVLDTAHILQGALIREPVSSGKGYWAGAPGACFDEKDNLFYLSYRIRRPRGVAPDRGGEARIAKSRDGIHFEDVWSVTKDAYRSPSIERCALMRGPDGRWHYFISFVEPADGRWCVEVLTAEEISALKPSQARRVFSAGGLGLEGVKDPWLMRAEDKFYIFLSVAVPTTDTTAESHATADIYNTGECRSQTGLAVSADLDNWEWLGVVFETPETGWDAYCRRINSVVPVGDGYLAFYDGGASHKDNYEEKTGLVKSADLRHWQTLTPDGPLFSGIPGSGSVRYMDTVVVGDTAYLYYELCRPDGSHEIRGLQVAIDGPRLPRHKGVQ